MKKIFISLGMHNRNPEDVNNQLQEIESYLKNKYGEVEVIHNYKTVGTETDGRLFYLGEAIKKLDKCDSCYFVKDWKNHKGCVIEHTVCELYNIEIMYE